MSNGINIEDYRVDTSKLPEFKKTQPKSLLDIEEYREEGLTFNALQKIFSNPMFLKYDKAFQEKADALKRSKVPFFRGLGGTMERWGGLGMFFGINTVIDGVVTGIISETYRNQAKQYKEKRTQGLYPVQAENIMVYASKEDIIKNYLPSATGEKTWEEFEKRLNERISKNQFMNEEPMGIWDSIVNSVKWAEHGVTLYRKAGADSKTAWILGMGQNILLDPTSWLNISTTPLGLAKFGKNIMKESELYHYLPTFIKKGVKGGIIAQQGLWAKADDLKAFGYRVMDATKLRKIPQKADDPISFIFQKGAIKTKAPVYTFEQLADEGTKIAFKGSYLTKYDDLIEVLKKTKKGRELLASRGVEVTKEMWDDIHWKDLFGVLPKQKQRHLLNVGDDFSLARFEPDLLMQLERIPKDFIGNKTGIRWAGFQLVSEQKLWEIAKKTGLVDLKRKLRTSLLGRAFIPGAKLQPQFHETHRFMTKGAVYIKDNIVKEANSILSRVPDDMRVWLSYAAEGGRKDLNKFLKQAGGLSQEQLSKLKGAELTKALTRYADPEEYAKAIEKFKPYEKFAKDIGELNKVIERIDSSFGITYAGKKQYLSHITDQVTFKRLRKVGELSPKVPYYAKKRGKAFPHLIDWKLAKIKNPDMDINFVEDAMSVINIRAGATGEAVMKRVARQFTFDEYGEAFPKKGWEFVGDTDFGVKITKGFKKGDYGKFFPSDIADYLNFEKEIITSGSVMNQILRLYDKYIKVPWSGLVTYRWPSFHGQNYVSSTVNTFMEYGKRILTGKSIKRGLDMTLDNTAGKTFTTSFGDVVDFRTAKIMGDVMGIPGWGWSGREAQKIRLMGEKWTDVIKRKKMLGLWEAWGKGGAEMGRYVEDIVRWQCFIEGWMKYGDPFRSAMVTKMLHFDYAELTPFERNWVTKGFAFYKFKRSNYPLQLKNYFLKRDKWTQMYRTFQTLEGISEDVGVFNISKMKFEPAMGKRTPEEEYPWFKQEYQARLPVKWADDPLYWRPDFMHLQIQKFPPAIASMFDGGKTGTEKFFGAVKPVTEMLYPWWKWPPENVFNYDMWRNRVIDWGEEGLTSAPGFAVYVAKAIPPLKKAFRLTEVTDKATGTKLYKMDAKWAHFINQWPFVYQMGLLFTSPKYGEWTEKQYPLDALMLATGIRLRSVSPSYAKMQNYWEYKRKQGVREKYQKRKIKAGREFGPKVDIEDYQDPVDILWDLFEYSEGQEKKEKLDIEDYRE